MKNHSHNNVIHYTESQILCPCFCSNKFTGLYRSSDIRVHGQIRHATVTNTLDCHSSDLCCTENKTLSKCEVMNFAFVVLITAGLLKINQKAAFLQSCSTSLLSVVRIAHVYVH